VDYERPLHRGVTRGLDPSVEVDRRPVPLIRRSKLLLLRASRPPPRITLRATRTDTLQASTKSPWVADGEPSHTC
jgi:hypothetical protein